MKTPPFDTGKVKIGLLYVPPTDYFPDEDASLIQSTLLNKGFNKWLNASNATQVHLRLAAGCLLALVAVVASVKW